MAEALVGHVVELQALGRATRADSRELALSRSAELSPMR
jgi:hypothetical protein